MSAPFDPSAHPSLAGLADRLPHLAGSSYSAGRTLYAAGKVEQRTASTRTISGSLQGSGAQPYRVTLGYSGDQPKPGCTCPAFRRNPWCKHVVALTLAALEAPATFEPVEAPPEVQAEGTKKPRAKRADKAPETAVLRSQGLDVLDRLLDTLAEGGLMNLGREQQTLIGSAADLVKGLKLRRLGTLLQVLSRAASGKAIEEDQFARLLTELYLVRTAVGAHLAGSVELEAALAEELLGRTWQPRDLEPLGGLELIEVATTSRQDEAFRVDTGYLLDLRRGTLYLERQITPVGLWAGPRAPYRLRLQDVQVGLYPGRGARRVKLLKWQPAPLTVDDLERVVSHAATCVRELRAALAAHHELPFELGELPVLFRPAAFATCDGAVAALDEHGHVLPLACRQDLARDAAALMGEPAGLALVGLVEQTSGGMALRVLSFVSRVVRRGRGPVVVAADPWVEAA